MEKHENTVSRIELSIVVLLYNILFFVLVSFRIPTPGRGYVLITRFWIAIFSRVLERLVSGDLARILFIIHDKV